MKNESTTVEAHGDRVELVTHLARIIGTLMCTRVDKVGYKDLAASVRMAVLLRHIDDLRYKSATFTKLLHSTGIARVELQQLLKQAIREQYVEPYEGGLDEYVLTNAGRDKIAALWEAIVESSDSSFDCLAASDAAELTGAVVAAERIICRDDESGKP